METKRRPCSARGQRRPARLPVWGRLYRRKLIIHANPPVPQHIFYKKRAFMPGSAGPAAPCPAVWAGGGRVLSGNIFRQSQPPQAAQSPSSGAGAAPPIFAPPSAGSMASATFSISAHSMRLRNSLQPYS